MEGILSDRHVDITLLHDEQARMRKRCANNKLTHLQWPFCLRVLKHSCCPTIEACNRV